MTDLWAKLMPHAHCFLNYQEWVPLYVLSNGVIFLAYTLISLTIIFVYIRRNEIAHRGLFLIYGVFISACGIGHLLMAINVYSGMYLIETIWHNLTALVSLMAMAYTIYLAPKLIRIPKMDHFNEFSRLSQKILDRDFELKELLDSTTKGWWVWQIQTGEDYLSDSWHNLLGYRQGELQHHVSTWENLMHPEDRARAGEAMNEHIVNKKPYILEARYKHKNGKWIKLRDRGRVIRWKDGLPITMVGYEEIVE